MAGLRLRRAGNAKMGEDETAKAEIILSLEEQMAHFWELSASLDGFSVSIRPPTIEMPLLKRLGEPNFVPNPPGLESLLQSAYQIISKNAVETLIPFVDQFVKSVGIAEKKILVDWGLDY